VEGLAEAYVQMETDGRRAVIDRDLAHVHVGSVGAHVEVTDLVETRVRMVEVDVGVAVEQETEIGTPVSEGRWRGGRSRGGRGCGRLRCGRRVLSQRDPR